MMCTPRHRKPMGKVTEFVSQILPLLRKERHNLEPSKADAVPSVVTKRLSQSYIDGYNSHSTRLAPKTPVAESESSICESRHNDSSEKLNKYQDASNFLPIPNNHEQLVQNVCSMDEFPDLINGPVYNPEQNITSLVPPTVAIDIQNKIELKQFRNKKDLVSGKQLDEPQPAEMDSLRKVRKTAVKISSATKTASFQTMISLNKANPVTTPYEACNVTNAACTVSPTMSTNTSVVPTVKPTAATVKPAAAVGSSLVQFNNAIVKPVGIPTVRPKKSRMVPVKSSSAQPAKAVPTLPSKPSTSATGCMSTINNRIANSPSEYLNQQVNPGAVVVNQDLSKSIHVDPVNCTNSTISSVAMASSGVSVHVDKMIIPSPVKSASLVQFIHATDKPVKIPTVKPKKSSMGPIKSANIQPAKVAVTLPSKSPTAAMGCMSATANLITSSPLECLNQQVFINSGSVTVNQDLSKPIYVDPINQTNSTISSVPIRSAVVPVHADTMITPSHMKSASSDSNTVNNTSHKISVRPSTREFRPSLPINPEESPSFSIANDLLKFISNVASPINSLTSMYPNMQTVRHDSENSYGSLQIISTNRSNDVCDNAVLTGSALGRTKCVEEKLQSSSYCETISNRIQPIEDGQSKRRLSNVDERPVKQARLENKEICKPSMTVIPIDSLSSVIAEPISPASSPALSMPNFSEELIIQSNSLGALQMSSLSVHLNALAASIVMQNSMGGDSQVTVDSTELVAADGSEMVTADGTEIITPDSTEIPSADGTEIVAANGNEIISADGIKMVLPDGTEMVSVDGTKMVSADGAEMVSADGTGMVSADGTKMVSADGAEMVSADGTGMVSADGTKMVSADGTGMVSANVTEMEGSSETIYTSVTKVDTKFNATVSSQSTTESDSEMETEENDDPVLMANLLIEKMNERNCLTSNLKKVVDNLNSLQQEIKNLCSSIRECAQANVLFSEETQIALKEKLSSASIYHKMKMEMGRRISDIKNVIDCLIKSTLDRKSLSNAELDQMKAVGKESDQNNEMEEKENMWQKFVVDIRDAEVKQLDTLKELTVAREVKLAAENRYDKLLKGIMEEECNLESEKDVETDFQKLKDELLSCAMEKKTVIFNVKSLDKKYDSLKKSIYGFCDKIIQATNYSELKDEKKLIDPKPSLQIKEFHKSRESETCASFEKEMTDSQDKPPAPTVSQAVPLVSMEMTQPPHQLNVLPVNFPISTSSIMCASNTTTVNNSDVGFSTVSTPSSNAISVISAARISNFGSGGVQAGETVHKIVANEGRNSHERERSHLPAPENCSYNTNNIQISIREDFLEKNPDFMQKHPHLSDMISQSIPPTCQTAQSIKPQTTVAPPFCPSKAVPSSAHRSAPRPSSADAIQHQKRKMQQDQQNAEHKRKTVNQLQTRKNALFNSASQYAATVTRQGAVTESPRHVAMQHVSPCNTPQSLLHGKNLPLQQQTVVSQPQYQQQHYFVPRTSPIVSSQSVALRQPHPQQFQLFPGHQQDNCYMSLQQQQAQQVQLAQLSNEHLNSQLLTSALFSSHLDKSQVMSQTGRNIMFSGPISTHQMPHHPSTNVQFNLQPQAGNIVQQQQFRTCYVTQSQPMHIQAQPPVGSHKYSHGSSHESGPSATAMRHPYPLETPPLNLRVGSVVRNNPVLQENIKSSQPCFLCGVENLETMTCSICHQSFCVACLNLADLHGH